MKKKPKHIDVTTTLYNRIAGQSLERLAALSDGLFAFAMTLLVLDIRVPEIGAIHGEAELWQGIVALAPRFVMYLMSFMTLGIFWVGQQTQFNHFKHADRDLAWIHIAFLAGVAVMPFTTSLLAEFITYRVALVIYWANIAYFGLVLYLSLGYACRAKLIKENITEDVARALQRRILIAQALYAAGAVLCAVNTYWSIGFIVLVQLNYVVAPRAWWRRARG
jgi:uncharacterized membrane protein